jgi:hypothetical protein
MLLSMSLTHEVFFIFAQFLKYKCRLVRLFGVIQHAGTFFGTVKRWVYDFWFLQPLEN